MTDKPIETVDARRVVFTQCTVFVRIKPKSPEDAARIIEAIKEVLR